MDNSNNHQKKGGKGNHQQQQRRQRLRPPPKRSCHLLSPSGWCCFPSRSMGRWWYRCHLPSGIVLLLFPHSWLRGRPPFLGRATPTPRRKQKEAKRDQKRKASQTQEGGPAQDGRLTQTPSFLWVVFPHSLVRWCCFSSSCFQLAFLLLPSWSWGCPPRPPRGEEKKKGNGSTTQKEEGQKQHPQEGSGIRAPQEEREREGTGAPKHTR